MAPQFDRPLRELLAKAGCVLVRQGRGSHEIWRSPITGR
ncbi:MAG TPA: type II toxin-antitoxin system HicA family toxin, partial [Roseiarcus sp.]|nr:type II toxin-antitoxin system HicA family toxin [Roseiarcus sp.]